MSVTSCLLTHFGAKSPIAAYRSELAGDVAELVADGMTTEAAWLKVTADKLAELKAERTRIEQVVADAYSKTAAGAAPDTATAEAAAEPAAAEPDESAAKRAAAAAEKQARQAARETQRSVFRELVAMPDMVGKNLAEIEASVRARLGGAALNDAQVGLLSRAISKDLGKRAVELEKQKHRHPEVRAAAIAAAVTGAFPVADIPVEQHSAFIGGFDHALSGRTKSTLSGENLPHQIAGYEAARRWIENTEEGAAFYEGRPATKLKNTGVDLKRHMDAMRAQMAADESDIKKAWKQIEGATARASLFAPLLPDGVTPGYRLYVERVRSNVRTFKEWLDKKDWLGNSYYRSRYSETKSNTEYILDGDRYPEWLSHEDRHKFQTDEAYRAQFLRDLAGEYISEVQKITTLLQGTSSVDEAARKWSDQYLARDVDATTDPASARYPRSTWSLNEAGNDLTSYKNSLWNGDKEEVSTLRRNSPWTRELVSKETTIELPNRAQQLVPPKLDRVTNDGPQVRAGKNTTPAEAKERYKFADVGFGNWVGAKQDQDHLNYADDAFSDLAAHFGAPLKGIGFGGRMHFTIGALGHGKFAAHFHAAQPSPDGGFVEVINVTNTRGDGTVYHEWIHALDHFLGGDWKASVRPALLNYLKHGVMTVEKVEQRAFDFLFGGYFWSGNKRGGKIEAAIKTMHRPDVIVSTSAYKSNADKLGKDYWGNDAELIARAGEAWAADTLGHTNTYLVNPEWVGDGKVTKEKGFRGTPYPTGSERKAFNLIYTALAKAVKWEDGKPTVKMADFKAALPDEITAGERRRQELTKPEAMRELNDLEAARREEARLLKADEAAQAKQREQQELDDLAEQALKKLQPPIVDGPNVADTKGPLTDDDLSSLFDEAAAELREEVQEQPDAPGPGEAMAEQEEAPKSASFSKWTLSDLDEILSKANNPDFVAIAGDPIWNVPDIHEVGRMGKTTFLGDGMFETTGRDEAGKPWSMTWDGGGAMRHTTGGRSWTNVNVSGRSPWPSGIKRALEAARDRKAEESRPDPGSMSQVERDIAASGRPDTRPADPSAAALIAEAAKLGVKGANEALTGLAKLFGGGKGRLNSFPAGFDEETYKQAKPHFQAALKAFQEAGKTLKDLFKMLIGQFGDGIKDYAIQFAKDEKLTASLGAAPSASMQVADRVQQQLNLNQPFDWRELFEWADAAWGGTQAEGKYTSRDAYDAMEAGMNRYLMQHAGTYTPASNREAALVLVSDLARRINLLPTQTKRTAEQDEFQQFSTVPALAFAANWVANVNPGDVMLEPSAGVGGLAVFAHNAGASLVLNELSSRRAAVLQQVLPSARVFHEDASQLDNILPDDVKPTVVVMNPPFSSAAGRGIKSTKEVGAAHIEQALDRLVAGGRLVAVTGKGMALDAPAFAEWWKKIRAEYDVRAVIPMDGAGYAKYGTTFDNVLVVIDKVKPKDGRNPISTPAKDYTELIGLLAEVRDERHATRIPASDRDPVERDIAESALGEPGAQDESGGAGDSATAGVGGGESLPGQVPGPTAPGGRGSRSSNRSRVGLRQPGGQPNAASQDSGRGGSNPGQQAEGDSGVSVTGATTTQASELTDSIFESYAPQRLQIPGAQPHPGPLVQSAAMASVMPPAATYTPNLPKATISKGLLSLAQLESVVYAGQAHSQMMDQTASEKDAKAYPGLKEGAVYRRGFFIGDGTGVGKGREIGGIILDNLRQGRKKHVWVSEKQGLLTDAKRDFKGVGGDDSILFNQNKTDAAGTIDSANGILFTTYSTLRGAAQSTTVGGFKKGDAVVLGRALDHGDGVESDVGKLVKIDKKASVVTVEWPGGKKIAHPFAQVLSINGNRGWISDVDDRSKKPPTRLDQLVKWLGPDFDGVIAFDEAHNAGNAIPIKGGMGSSEPSAQALAVVELQARLPNARVLYVSATGATEVSNLSFAARLGLWGMGTPFPTVHNFVDEMTAGGLATMELVARDMKQMGAYLARSLSFDGVTYSRVEHELTPLQTDIYNKLAEAWQVALRDMMAALELTGVVDKDGRTRNSKAVAAMKSQFWGTQQRFFNQVITSMQMPTVLEQIERDLAGGDAIVLQLVNTNEAQQERALAKKNENGESEDLEDLDLTPRDQLMQMVAKAFPVAQYEDYVDESGKRQTRIVIDSEGRPVTNKKAEAMRDALLRDLKDIRVPDGPLELILNAFGPETTAEVTGRKQRVVRKADADGNVTAQLERRGPSAARADADSFMADKKRILIFSDAGGTGFSFHADMTKANQRKRKHYLLQPGWRANKAIQGMGRSHRTNQKQPPHFALAATNIPAHKRFLSSIARRLDQLGAMTKGQRDTSSGGLFSEKDNLESEYATQAVKRLLNEAKAGQISGVNFNDMLTQLGLEDIVNKDTGQIAENKFPPTPQFLNRMLSLSLDMQEKVFTAFATRMEEQVELAAQRGTLDVGMQTIRALESKILQEETIYTDERTGAETKYVELELKHATRFFPFPTEKSQGSKIEWLTNAKSGRVWARVRSGDATLRSGAVVPRYRMLGTGGMQIRTEEDFEGGNYDAIDQDEARALWDKETAARPPTYTDTTHMIVGALLPIWDRIKTSGAMQVARTQTVDGRRLLGRVIHQKEISELLKRLNIASPESKLPPDQILARILKGDVAELANGWKIERARVSGDLRVELNFSRAFASQGARRELVDLGVLQERIGWNDRYFIPTGSPEVLAKILKSKPLVELQNPNAAGESTQLSISDEAASLQLDATGLDQGYSNGDTAAYELAGRADADAVADLQSRLNAGRPRSDWFVLDAVAPRAGAPGSRGQTLQAVATVAKRLFGHRVVFVKFQGRPLFNGAVDAKNPFVIFLNVDAKQPLMSVLGHELLHKLRDNVPHVYRELVGRLERVMKNQPDYYSELARRYKAAKIGVPAEWLEELHADIVGDHFTDPQFWRDLARDKPTLFRRVVQAVLKFLDDVLEGLGRSYRTERFVTDVETARAAVVDAMRQFSSDQVDQMADAEGGIRLSEWAANGGADQTDTPAFKRWFGDSKVVDAQGKPLVVYHGTNKDIAKFEPKRGAIWFADDHQLANQFVGGGRQNNGKRPGKGAAVYPAYLRMVRPLDLTDMSLGETISMSEILKMAGAPSDDAALAAIAKANLDSKYAFVSPGMGDPAQHLVGEYKRGRRLSNLLDDRALIDALKAAGIDGFKLTEEYEIGPKRATMETMSDTFAVFDSDQIKSATGNRGTFDPTNPDIRLSIADTLQERVKAIRGLDQQKVRNAFADFVGSAGAKVSWWDKHLGTQYAKAEKFPAYKRVFERVQKYIEDVSTLANEAADQAPAILPKLQTWKDLRASFQQFGLEKADAVAVAAPIFQGTLIDQKAYTDDELRVQFGLKPAQIKAYRQFLSAVNTSLDQVVAADVLRLLGDKNPGLNDLALADREALRGGIDEYLSQQIDASHGKEKADFQALQSDIRDKYDRVDKLKHEGYAPLMRFGQYKVYIEDPESGDSLFFGLYESKAEANRMARELAEDPQFKDKKIEQGMLSQEQYKLFSSVPVESLEMFASAIGAEKSEIFQAYLRLTKNNRDALKRLIHRKGTAGFSEDVPRVLASFVTSNSRLASGSMNMTAARRAADDIRDGDVKDEAIQLVDSVQNPQETAPGARALMFANFIGGSVASAAVNLTQPVTMTLPYLSQFGGMAKSAARLMAAAKMAATGKIDDPEIKKAMQRAEDDGTVSPQEIHHLTAQAMGSWGNTALSKQAAFIWGAPFSLAEQFNRRVTFIAAYKTAQAEGLDDPFAFAEKAVIETQGLYNKGNMPNLSRSALGAMAMQFKQYSIHYLEWMKRMWNAGEPGSDQRRAGRRAVLIALALLMVAAGTDGLPFADDLDDLIDTIGQALGYDTNSKRARRNLIANTLGMGDETADVMARGLSAIPGVPLDVSLRMGMGNLLPGTGMFLRSNTDRSRDLLEFAGPAGGMAKQYLDAAQKGLGGDISGMLKGMVPMALQNAMKALDMWQTGEARDPLGRKIMDADQVDGLMKFLGFNPSSIARESQKMGMIRRSEQLAKNVEGEIAGKWARAFADGDSEGVASARAELADWNEKNPEDRIKIDSAQILQRVRKLRQSRAQRFITSVSPERRSAIKDTMQ
jgi:tRNA G10  N-methylase Trm11